MHRYVSLLDHYTDNVTLFVNDHVVLAPLLLLLAEEMGLPILVPGDAILGYVGYSLSTTHTATLWEAFLLAMTAVILGASILFFVAKRWGQTVLKGLGRYIFLQDKHLDKAEVVFQKYGIWAIIFGRHIPGLRIPITIFAASSGIKYQTFISCTIVSTTLWVLFYLSIGKRYGSDVQQLMHKYVGLSVGIIAAVGILIIGLHVLGAYRQRKAPDS